MMVFMWRYVVSDGVHVEVCSWCWHVCVAHTTSSGTALMVVKPFLNTTKTLRAPQRSAEVAQSKAVSPAPSTITEPCSWGSVLLHWHIPGSHDIT